MQTTVGQWLETHVPSACRESVQGQIAVQGKEGAIWHADITALPPLQVFRGVTNYSFRVGKISGLSLHRQDPEVLRAAKTFTLEAQYLEELRNQEFEGMTSLAELSLINCRLTRIYPHAFYGLTSLTTLDLSDNGINYLSESLFADLPCLKVLDLSRNKLTSLSQSFLEALPQDLTLDLRDNALDVDTRERLIILQRLRPDLKLLFELSQAQKQLESQLKIFKRLETKRLLLGGNRDRSNKLASFPYLWDFKDATSVWLDDHALTAVPSRAFWNMPDLTTVTLRDNQLRYIDLNAFEGCPKISELYLNNNQLSHLDPDMLRGLQLKELRLGYNHFRDIPRAFFEALPDGCVVDLTANTLNENTARLIDEINQSGRLKITYTHVVPGYYAHPMPDFEDHLQDYLQTDDLESFFWQHPDFANFRRWVCELHEINIPDPQARHDFRKSITDILLLFRRSPDFRSHALAAISDHLGCGDLKTVIYALLMTGKAFFQPESNVCSIQELQTRYLNFKAVQLIIRNVDHRRIRGDHSGQIAAALHHFNTHRNIGLDNIGICFPHTTTPIQPFLDAITRETEQELASPESLDGFLLLPHFKRHEAGLEQIQQEEQAHLDAEIEAYEDERAARAEAEAQAKKAQAQEAQDSGAGASSRHTHLLSEDDIAYGDAYLRINQRFQQRLMDRSLEFLERQQTQGGRRQSCI